MLKLEIIDELERGRRYVNTENLEVLVICRARDNDIVLSDTSVSRFHAQMIIDQGQVFIEDLQSANGVLVNRQRIEQRTELFLGDEITVGTTRILISEMDVQP